MNTTQSTREKIRQLAEEYAIKQREGSQPTHEEFLARIDPSSRDELEGELVGEDFANRFGDARLNGNLRYRPIKFLGKGYFGEVYQAVDDDLDRNIAIKVLIRDYSNESSERFRTEAKNQASVSHRHLVAVFDRGKLPKGYPYIVMQYVDGGTLRQRLKAEGKLDAKTAARLVEQIAQAVAAVHKGTSGSKLHSTTPLVHRDLKPENILLDSLGDAYLADLGVAAAVIDLHDGAARAAGTPAYMSPEQATAFRGVTPPASVDTRTDVWALGVILYELLTGRQPFVSNASDEVLKRDEILEAIERFHPTRLRDLSPDAPPELEKLIDECLKKDVSERIETANEVAERLRRWLESVAATPVPLDFSARLVQARKDFSDRPWLFDEVDAWQAHQNEPLLLLKGELGSGKSAFLAELIHRNPNDRILAWHLCRHDWPDSRSAAKFVRSVAGMLAQRVEGYRSKLADLNLMQALRIEDCENDPASAFQSAISTPLADCKSPAAGISFVVVDAIDEADQSERSSIPDLVAQWAGQLPDWLRLIVSVRRDALESNTLAKHRHLDIDRENTVHKDNILEDIKGFIRQRLSEPNLAERLQHSRVDAQAAIGTILDKCEANFLYVAEALVAIERDQITFAELGKLPPGLSRLYADFFRRQWPNRRNFEDVQPILEVLISSQEPMPEDLVAAATSLDDDKLGERLEALAQYLAGRPNQISLRHKALVDWLAGNSGIHQVSRKHGHKRLADTCWKEYERYTKGEGHLSSYAVSHLPHHLENAAKWRELSDLLTNLPFLEAKVEAGMVFGLIRDLRSASAALPPRNQKRGIINQIVSAIADHAAFLDEHRDHVLQCLYNAAALTWREDADTSPPANSLRATANQWQGSRSGKTWVRQLRRADPSAFPSFRFHVSAITALAVFQAANEERDVVVSADRDGSIVVWGSTGQVFDRTKFPKNPHIAEIGDKSITTRSRHYCTCVQWSVCGQLLVTGNTNGKVQTWEVREGRLKQTNNGQPLHEFHYYRPGSASSSNPDVPPIRIPIPIERLAISESARLCAAAVSESAKIYIARIADHLNIEFDIPGENDSCTSLAFVPGSDDLLAVGTKSGKVYRLWLAEDLLSRKLAEWRILKDEFASPIVALASSQLTKKFLALITKRWDCLVGEVLDDGDINWQPLQQFSCEGIPVQVALGNSGSHVAVLTDASQLVLLSLIDSTITVHSGIEATSIAASRFQDASFYVGMSSGEVLMFHASDAASHRSMPTWSAIGWSRKKMGIAQADGTIRFFDLLQNSTLSDHTGRPTGSPRNGIFFDQDNRIALFADSDEVILCHTAGATVYERVKTKGRIAGFGGASDVPRFAVVEEERVLTIWQTDQQAREIASESLRWTPSCVCLSRDGTIVAAGGQDAALFGVDHKLRPFKMSVLEWLRRNRQDLLHNSRLDESWLAEDGIDLRPSGDFSTERLGISSVALSDDGSLLAMGFRSNTLACLPVRALEEDRTDNEMKVYQVPHDLSSDTTRWIVEVRLSSDGQNVAARQSGGMGLVVNRASGKWRSIGWCAALGDWAFDGKIGLFSGSFKSDTEVRDIQTGSPLAFLPQPLELVGIGPDVDFFVARCRGARNGTPMLFRIER